MISIPSDLEARDVSQWIEGGWFFVKQRETELMEVCQLMRIRESGPITVINTSGDAIETRKDFIFPHWPVCGALNMDGYVVVLQRNSQRQYRRTYNSRCLTLTVPRKWDTMKACGVELVKDANDVKVVEEAFSPTYYPFGEACNKLADGAVSVALNPHLIVAGNPDGMLVYYRGKLSGQITGSRLVPLGCDEARTRRLLKFFDGRITL